MSMLNEVPPATAAEADGDVPACEDCGAPQTVLADEVERVRGLLLAEKARSRELTKRLADVADQRDALMRGEAA